MLAVLVPSLFAVVLLAVWIYALFDVITTDEVLVRNLPKLVWVLIVVFLWAIGAILWFAAGRPVNAGLRPGPSRPQAPGSRRFDAEAPPRRRRPQGPEDDDGWSDFNS